MKFRSIRIKVTFLAICLASSLCSYADQTILLLQSEKQTDLLLVQSKKLIPLLKSTLGNVPNCLGVQISLYSYRWKLRED